MASVNEKELIAELKKSSQKAFDSIYQIYSARLYAYCLQYTKSREDSEEIVQDVFIKLWANRERIIQEDTLQSFIFKIAKNQLINIYRSRINSFTFEAYVDHYNDKALSVNDTSHLIEYDDFCRVFDKVLSSLSETQRKVIDHCKLKQYSNKETAEKLQLKEQTVKNQLSLGLKILKEELRKHFAWLIILLLFVKDLFF